MTKDEALKLALEALEMWCPMTATYLNTRDKSIAAIKEALAQQPISNTDELAQPEQEPKQSEIFCGVDFADGMLFVSVLRRRVDNVAELLHAEQIELPAQPEPEPVATWENKYGMKEWQVHALRAGWSPTPPHRKPLTEEEIEKIWRETKPYFDKHDFARAIEAAHNIKE